MGERAAGVDGPLHGGHIGLGSVTTRATSLGDVRVGWSIDWYHRRVDSVKSLFDCTSARIPESDHPHRRSDTIGTIIRCDRSVKKSLLAVHRRQRGSRSEIRSRGRSGEHRRHRAVSGKHVSTRAIDPIRRWSTVGASVRVGWRRSGENRRWSSSSVSAVYRITVDETYKR